MKRWALQVELPLSWLDAMLNRCFGGELLAATKRLGSVEAEFALEVTGDYCLARKRMTAVGSKVRPQHFGSMPERKELREAPGD